MGGVRNSFPNGMPQSIATHHQLAHRNISLCQAAVAQAVEAFGRVDILFCCASEGAGVQVEYWLVPFYAERT